MNQTAVTAHALTQSEQKTTYKILFIMGLCHHVKRFDSSCNPCYVSGIGKIRWDYDFTELGFIAFYLNIVSSLIQPFIGAI